MREDEVMSDTATSGIENLLQDWVKEDLTPPPSSSVSVPSQWNLLDKATDTSTPLEGIQTLGEDTRGVKRTATSERAGKKAKSATTAVRRSDRVLRERTSRTHNTKPC